MRCEARGFGVEREDLTDDDDKKDFSSSSSPSSSPIFEVFELTFRQNRTHTFARSCTTASIERQSTNVRAAAAAAASEEPSFENVHATKAKRKKRSRS